MSYNKRFMVLSIVIALSGCSFASDALFPSLYEEEEDEVSASLNEENQEVTSNTSANESQPAVAETLKKSSDNDILSASETVVGAKVKNYASEFNNIKDNLIRRNQEFNSLINKSTDSSKNYHETIALIKAKLQAGTTPGNPILRAKWENAKKDLDSMNKALSGLNQLSAQVDSDAAMLSYLLDAIKSSYSISGAVDEDHKKLKILEDEANKASLTAERMLKDLNQEISRKQKYLFDEEKNHTELSSSINVGKIIETSFSQSRNPEYYKMTAASSSKSFMDYSSRASVSNKPLVVIRFDKASVQYDYPLSNAVQKALAKKADVIFEIAGAGSAADGTLSETKRKMEEVAAKIESFGVSKNNIALLKADSNNASVPEVYVYVK